MLVHARDGGTGVLCMKGFNSHAAVSSLGLVSAPDREVPTNARPKTPSSTGVNADTLMTRWRETVRKPLFPSGW